MTARMDEGAAVFRLGVLLALLAASAVATPSEGAPSLCRNACAGVIVCHYPLSNADRKKGIGAVLFQQGVLGIFSEKNRSRSGELHASENGREAGENVTLQACAERFDADGHGDSFACFPEETIEYQGFFPCGGGGDGPLDDPCDHNPQAPECNRP